MQRGWEDCERGVVKDVAEAVTRAMKSNTA